MVSHSWIGGNFCYRGKSLPERFPFKQILEYNDTRLALLGSLTALYLPLMVRQIVKSGGFIGFTFKAHGFLLSMISISIYIAQLCDPQNGSRVVGAFIAMWNVFITIVGFAVPKFSPILKIIVMVTLIFSGILTQGLGHDIDIFMLFANLLPSTIFALLWLFVKNPLPRFFTWMNLLFVIIYLPLAFGFAYLVIFQQQKRQEIPGSNPLSLPQSVAAQSAAEAPQSDEVATSFTPVRVRSITYKDRTIACRLCNAADPEKPQREVDGKYCIDGLEIIFHPEEVEINCNPELALELGMQKTRYSRDEVSNLLDRLEEEFLRKAQTLCRENSFIIHDDYKESMEIPEGLRATLRRFFLSDHHLNDRILVKNCLQMVQEAAEELCLKEGDIIWHERDRAFRIGWTYAVAVAFDKEVVSEYVYVSLEDLKAEQIKDRLARKFVRWDFSEKGKAIAKTDNDELGEPAPEPVLMDRVKFFYEREKDFYTQGKSLEGVLKCRSCDLIDLGSGNLRWIADFIADDLKSSDIYDRLRQIFPESYFSSYYTMSIPRLTIAKVVEVCFWIHFGRAVYKLLDLACPECRWSDSSERSICFVQQELSLEIAREDVRFYFSSKRIGVILQIFLELDEVGCNCFSVKYKTASEELQKKQKKELWGFYQMAEACIWKALESLENCLEITRKDYDYQPEDGESVTRYEFLYSWPNGEIIIRILLTYEMKYQLEMVSSEKECLLKFIGLVGDRQLEISDEEMTTSKIMKKTSLDIPGLDATLYKEPADKELGNRRKKKPNFVLKIPIRKVRDILRKEKDILRKAGALKSRSQIDTDSTPSSRASSRPSTPRGELTYEGERFFPKDGI